MICQRCGAEIDTRYTFPDGSVQCPGCGLMYRPTYAPQQPQRQAPQQAPQMQQFQQPEQPASPRRRRSAQYADNPPEPPRNNPPPVYPTRNDDEPPKKKSSKKWLIIVAAVLCVLVLAFVGIRIFGGSKKSSGKQIASADMSGVKIEQISASDIAVDEETKVKYVKGELVFVAKDGVTFEQVDDYFRDGGFYENGTELVSYDTTLGIYIVKHSYGASYFELGNEAEITLNYTDLFEDIFPNYVVDIAENSVNDKEWQPWDSKKEQHWGWDAIYMNEAQARLDGMQLTDVDVGVIDNQFYGHDDIGVWNTSYGVDYNSSIKSPEHGTHVSGIIGAANNNGVGIAGVTDRIRLHCFSTYGFSVSGEAEGGSMAITTWLTAIGQLVERNNCKVINISQGFAWKDRKDVKNDDGSQPSQEEYEQIQRQGMDEYLPHVEKILRKILKKHDFLLVVSAGNSNNDDQQSGKAELNSIFNYIKAEDITPHILVVGSASKTKGGSIYISDYSSYGDRVDVTAPGDNIYSTVPKKDGFMSFLTGSNIYNSGYEYMSGTSMSAPYITGIAALVWNINPNFTSAQVRQFIERGCEATYGYREGQWFSRNETHLFVDAEHVVSNALLEMSISANPPTEPSTPEVPAESTDKPDPVTEEPSSASNINWSTHTFEYTNVDGYKIRVTLKYSPWMLLSKKELINSAWRQIGKGETLPITFEDWGLAIYSGETYYKGSQYTPLKFSATMNDMYYVLGECTIENITDGWHASTEKPISTNLGLGFRSEEKLSDMYVSYGCQGLLEVFYSEPKFDFNVGSVSPKMTSDKWGPVRFVLAAPEYFTPNYPYGMYRSFIEKSYLYLAGDNTIDQSHLYFGIQE